MLVYVFTGSLGNLTGHLEKLYSQSFLYLGFLYMYLIILLIVLKVMAGSPLLSQ